MGVEDEFGIDHKRVAAIVHHFRRADEVIGEDTAPISEKLESYFGAFGEINFAALEMIFRENNFNTHLVAIPTTFIEAQDPNLMVVDPNDMRFRDTLTPMPFVIGFCSSMEKVEATAKGSGFVYNAEENLQNLRRTGVVVAREQVGVVKSITDPRQLGLRIPSYRGHPRSDRRQAQWN